VRVALPSIIDVTGRDSCISSWNGWLRCGVLHHSVNRSFDSKTSGVDWILWWTMLPDRLTCHCLLYYVFTQVFIVWAAVIDQELTLVMFNSGPDRQGHDPAPSGTRGSVSLYVRFWHNDNFGPIRRTSVLSKISWFMLNVGPFLWIGRLSPNLGRIADFIKFCRSQWWWNSVLAGLRQSSPRLLNSVSLSGKKLAACCFAAFTSFPTICMACTRLKS
jgi:hypothetical protein